jgi:hypothetical protein
VRGVNGETELVFTMAEGAGAKKYLIEENASAGTVVELGKAFMEETGAGGVFKVVEGKEIGGVPMCAFPPEGDKLNAKQKCIVGVEFAVATRGETAKFVQEFGARTQNEARATIQVRSE